MGAVIHIGVHGAICVLQLLKTEFITKALGEHHRHYPFVNVLVNGKRNRQALQYFLGPLVKIKSLCGVHYASPS